MEHSQGQTGNPKASHAGISVEKKLGRLASRLKPMEGIGVELANAVNRIRLVADTLIGQEPQEVATDSPVDTADSLDDYIASMVTNFSVILANLQHEVSRLEEL